MKQKKKGQIITTKLTRKKNQTGIQVTNWCQCVHPMVWFSLQNKQMETNVIFSTTF